MRWVQVQIWFTKSKPSILDVEHLFYEIVSHFADKIYRKFYLYEDTPDAFLAMESMNELDLNEVRKFIKSRELKWIRFLKVVDNTTDYENQETFLDVMDAVTRFNLYHLPRSKGKSGKLRSEIQYLKHIVHCITNMYWADRVQELKFYQYLFKSYGGFQIAKQFSLNDSEE